MSAAPRPVTATVTKRPSKREVTLQRSLHELSRALSSSSDSTSSLCSVLDHDSYESISGSSSDEDRSLSDESSPKKTVSSVSTSETSSAKPKEKVMTAWETWLVRKEKLLRKKLKEQTEKEKEEEAKKQREEQEKMEKLRRAESVRTEWLEHKNQEERTRRKNLKQKKTEEQQEKENKKKIIEEKSKESYEEWKQLKLQSDRERRAREKEEKKRKQEEDLEKKSQSEAAFEAWCRKAQLQPKSMNNSFGYTCGKLTGYHDRASYPVPSFYNPIPWKGPDIPKQNREKQAKKKTVKYKWDPNKYY